jgi:hypothetical protein
MFLLIGHIARDSDKPTTGGPSYEAEHPTDATPYQKKASSWSI